MISFLHRIVRLNFIDCVVPKSWKFPLKLNAFLLLYIHDICSISQNGWIHVRGKLLTDTVVEKCTSIKYLLLFFPSLRAPATSVNRRKAKKRHKVFEKKKKNTTVTWWQVSVVELKRLWIMGNQKKRQHMRDNGKEMISVMWRKEMTGKNFIRKRRKICHDRKLMNSKIAYNFLSTKISSSCSTTKVTKNVLRRSFINQSTKMQKRKLELSSRFIYSIGIVFFFSQQIIPFRLYIIFMPCHYWMPKVLSLNTLPYQI